MRRPATRPDDRRPDRLVIVDSSAVVAILFGEPAATELLARLAAYPERQMSVVNYVEAGTVLAGRHHGDRADAISDLDAFLDEAGITMTGVDTVQAQIALAARIRFGRGMGHGGALNFGDTFAYALARERAAPLLFTGNDFKQTDVAVALAAGRRS
jgi:ribonuclease VapC